MDRALGTRRTRATVVALAVLAFWAAACGGIAEVEGERSASGACPEDTCSASTPEGLRFVGLSTFDTSTMLQLGPIAEHGIFELGFYSPTTDGDLPTWHVEVDSDVFKVATIDVPDSHAFYGATGAVRLQAYEPGTTYVRIVDSKGALLDRVQLQILAVSDIRVVNAAEPTRPYVVAGCEEGLGIQLYAHDGSGERRVLDQSLDVRTSASTRPDPGMWDCFMVQPEEEGEVIIEVSAGEQTTHHTMPVVTLEEAGMTECPATLD